MDEPTGRGAATLVEDGVEFDGSDAALLRAIARTGSVARASTELSRSRARALTRVETLEVAFGDLVERRRGGSDGGGSRLTDAGARLLTRYDRLAAALAATASVPETVLEGTIAETDGELAAVETAVGTVWSIHDALGVGDAVQVRIGADAVTVRTRGSDPAGGETSARNRHRGTIDGVDRGETVHTVRVRVGAVAFRALVTDESAERLGIQADEPAWIAWKATATRLVADAALDA